jgi:hypothetical protein
MTRNLLRVDGKDSRQYTAKPAAEFPEMLILFAGLAEFT